jgi:hypothetical protein
MGSPSLIASTGHSGRQVPHARQASLILWAISLNSFVKVKIQSRGINYDLNRYLFADFYLSLKYISVAKDIPKGDF